MRLMVVDTALGLCTVGVFEVDARGARPLGVRSEPMVKGHSERIAGFARDAAKQAGLAFADLDRIGVTANKQVIPDDPRPPLRPSGVRLGTPACTTRGMGEEDMARIGGWIVQALRRHNDPEAVGRRNSRPGAGCSTATSSPRTGWAAASAGSC